MCNHVEYMIDLALMDDHSLRKKDTAILITTGHTDASVYCDDGYDLDSSPHIIWRPPVDGESGGGVCRDYYEKDGSESVRYSFCPNHVWLTHDEYPHVKKECKCASHAKAKGFSFTSSNECIRMVIDLAKEKKKQSDSIMPAQCLEPAKPAAKYPGKLKKAPRFKKGKKLKTAMAVDGNDKVASEKTIVDVSKVDGAP